VLLSEPILPYQLMGGAFILIGSILLETLGNAHRTHNRHRAHLHQRRAHRA
jgi:drug/metabolite transporter (DMT)-like permease